MILKFHRFRPRSRINLLIRSIIRLADEPRLVEYVKRPFFPERALSTAAFGCWGRSREEGPPILYIAATRSLRLFINKREPYSTALGAVCITNLKEANLEALLAGMEYKIQ